MASLLPAPARSRKVFPESRCWPSKGVAPGVVLGVVLRSDAPLKLAPSVEDSRKCSVIPARRYRLTDRHVLMLQALAGHKALTRKHLTDLFFGSVRRCQVHVAYLKRLGLIKATTGLPRPQRGSAPPVYALTAAGARVVNRDGRSLLMRTYRHLVGSDLHLRHTVAVNDFFTQLLTAARSQGGHLEWLGEDACRAYGSRVIPRRPRCAA